MINSVMTGEQKVRVPWKKAYILVLILFIGYIAYRGYNFGMAQLLHGQEETLQNDIASRDAEIQKANASTDYSTYKAAKQLLLVNTQGSRLDRLSRVIAIFTTLQTLGNGNVKFSDFKIDFDLISLR